MTDQEFEHWIWEGMMELGWLFPTTVEAVEIAERGMASEEMPDTSHLPTAEEVWAEIVRRGLA